ncbi:hypothetical protein IAD21_04276 [Abditibacteriota bacterium]|nr:hypothetical protein IAD21_04276 [Abditibacteriota bacterium]
MSVLSPASLSSPVPTRTMQRRLWWRRGAALVGAGAVLLVGWWGFQDDEISPVAPEPESPLIAEKTSQIVRKDGKRLWQFDASRIELSPDGSQTFAHRVSKGILFRDDKPFLNLSAQLVHLENTSNNVEATGGVKASGDNRFAVSSRLVRWNYSLKRLSCPTRVNAQLRDFSFEAPRLNYQWDAGELTCDQPVELRAPGIVLGAKRLKASTKTRVLDLGGGVHLSFDTKTAHPEKLKDLLSTP